MCYCTVKLTEAQPLLEDAHTGQCIPGMGTNLCGWTHRRTFACLKVYSLNVLYVGDLTLLLLIERRKEPGYFLWT